MVIRRPKDGDTREVTRFLWLPKRFDGGWYWLETVTFRQVYLYHGTLPGWEDVCLVADRVGPRGNDRPFVRGTRRIIHDKNQPMTMPQRAKSHTYERGCPEVALTESQEASLRRLWFVYGNGGPRQGHRHDHYFIQRFLDAGQDQRSLYPHVSQECLDAVDAVLSQTT